jgi:hypothetical protein
MIEPIVAKSVLLSGIPGREHLALEAQCKYDRA